MRNIQINVVKKYILFPIMTEQPLKELSIFVGEECIYEFRIPIAEGEEIYCFQYYAPVSLEKYVGHKISIEGEVSDAFLEAISFCDSIPQKSDSHPIIHFTPNTGWLNDPNGFYFREGMYHLYFQHNPMNTIWGNMTWGHAVSRDLLHWEQRESVLYPDEEGHMFSGSAIINERGLLGLPKDTPLFFYTVAGNLSSWCDGKKYMQKLAYSLDNGNTLQKAQTVVPHIDGDNRDPKVYWHDESKGYYMVLYLDKCEFAILRSENLSNWTITQRLELEGAKECPDLVKVPVEGGGRKWMFWCADGFYYLGEFDGYIFTQTEPPKQAYLSSLPYAAQTCWGEERVISIPWLRCGNNGRTYTGAMGIPRELSLVHNESGYKLRQNPIREIENYQRKIDVKCADGDSFIFSCDTNLAINAVLQPSHQDFVMSFGKVEIRYDHKEKNLQVTGCCKQKYEEYWRKAEQSQINSADYMKEILMEDSPEMIEVLFDHEILEITIDGGLGCAAFEIAFRKGKTDTPMEIHTKGMAEVFEIA